MRRCAQRAFVNFVDFDLIHRIVGVKRPRQPHTSQASVALRPATERESSLLISYWSESTLSSDDYSRPASRLGSLNSVFQVAFKLPS